MPRIKKRGGRNNNPSGRNQYSDWGVVEMIRERPIAATAAAAGAAAAGLFLWSKRAQIGDQISTMSDQLSEWSHDMRSDFDDTAGLTTSSRSSRSGGARMARSASGRGRAKSQPTT